jgi:uncharacterized LabA/DUF88 family protein
MSIDKRVFALLIDGDNAQPSLIPQILDKIKQYGEIGIKRVYGDWSQEQLKVWKDIVNRYAIGTSHRFNGSKNKNATDIALVIDAMDILHEEKDRINAFCIVSSDSDFAHLAIRIREQNLMVLGIGIENTPFREVCDEFITIESLQPVISNNGVTATATAQLQTFPNWMTFDVLFVNAYEYAISKNLQNDEERVHLRDIRDIMKEQDPTSHVFDYQNMRLFVEKAKESANIYPHFIEIQELIDNKPVIHYARMDYEIIKLWMAYKRAIDVYKFTDSEDWVTLSAIEYAFGELFSVGYSSTKKFLKAIRKMRLKYHTIIEMNDYADGEEITHYIRIGKEHTHELDKFRNGYLEAIKTDKVVYEEGWITLAILGSLLRKLYPEYDPLTYCGTKYSKLGKVVEIMSKVYPNVIEMKGTNTTTFVRVKG